MDKFLEVVFGGALFGFIILLVIIILLMLVISLASLEISWIIEGLEGAYDWQFIRLTLLAAWVFGMLLVAKLNE